MTRYPVEVDVQFTRADIPGQNTLLVKAYVQRKSSRPEGVIKQQIVSEIRAKILEKSSYVTPLIDVIVLEDLN